MIGARTKQFGQSWISLTYDKTNTTLKKMKGITDYNSRYCRILKKVHTSNIKLVTQGCSFYTHHSEAELSLLLDLADGTERISEVLIVGGDPSGTSCIKNEFAKICWLSN